MNTEYTVDGLYNYWIQHPDIWTNVRGWLNLNPGWYNVMKANPTAFEYYNNQYQITSSDPERRRLHNIEMLELINSIGSGGNDTIKEEQNLYNQSGMVAAGPSIASFLNSNSNSVSVAPGNRYMMDTTVNYLSHSNTSTALVSVPNMNAMEYISYYNIPIPALSNRMQEDSTFSTPVKPSKAGLEQYHREKIKLELARQSLVAKIKEYLNNLWNTDQELAEANYREYIYATYLKQYLQLNAKRDDRWEKEQKKNDDKLRMDKQKLMEREQAMNASRLSSEQNRNSFEQQRISQLRFTLQ